jgi:hypothetical protein
VREWEGGSARHIAKNNPGPTFTWWRSYKKKINEALRNPTRFTVPPLAGRNAKQWWEVSSCAKCNNGLGSSLLQSEALNIITWNISFISHRIRKNFRVNAWLQRKHTAWNRLFVSCGFYEIIRSAFTCLHATWIFQQAPQIYTADQYESNEHKLSYIPTKCLSYRARFMVRERTTLSTARRTSEVCSHSIAHSCTHSLSRDVIRMAHRNGTQFMVVGFVLIGSTAFVAVFKSSYILKNEAHPDIS